MQQGTRIIMRHNLKLSEEGIADGERPYWLAIQAVGVSGLAVCYETFARLTEEMYQKSDPKDAAAFLQLIRDFVDRHPP